MAYQTAANQIIKDSIKSAIFIDENALPFYGVESESTIYEEQLSKELFNNFRDNGISLAVHKFEIGNEIQLGLKQYLFDNRDLVLLDWKLDGEQGEDYSLKLLSDVVKKSNIHFCVIYTSEPDINSIYGSILSFFSGRDRAFYEKLKEEFEADENELREILANYNLFNTNSNGRLVGALDKIEKGYLNKIIEFAGISQGMEALKHLKLAFDNYPKSDIPQIEPEYDLLSREQNTLVINNTIISIVNKNKRGGVVSDANSIISRFSSQISESKNSFTQLLGFEMQSVFTNQSSFIDSNLLKVSKDALLKHRKALLEKEGSDISFKTLIKNVLIEQASMSLRTANLSLLNNELLDVLTQNNSGTPSSDSLMAMNVFYNSAKLNGKTNGTNLNVNFGDVFINNNEYYLCVTALCDCLRPDKIKSNYFFVKGKPIPSEIALRLGDSAFISFVTEETVVSWVLTDDEAGTLHQYKPVYIKPLTYNIKSPEIIEGEIEIRRIVTKKVDLEKDEGEFDWQTVKYITTLRPNYAQRIANHAFTHPVRVGVDFVTIN
ncbi:MAG: hypothetical protein GQ564_03230 [Bacteroidales bacterium]|nr:hypothetical protein [Bacteroidales bacterium]